MLRYALNTLEFQSREYGDCVILTTARGDRIWLPREFIEKAAEGWRYNEVISELDDPADIYCQTHC